MISSLQMEGVDSSLDMQMVWLETCSQAVINLFEIFSHSPLTLSLQGQGSH